ncbi:hypothetical protein HDU96_007238 [Phlyctochytrium bullatum]|nr:hypothetical protein HDU96_007238 [Phlyctochytrium bullatum]
MSFHERDRTDITAAETSPALEISPEVLRLLRPTGTDTPPSDPQDPQNDRTASIDPEVHVRVADVTRKTLSQDYLDIGPPAQPSGSACVEASNTTLAQLSTSQLADNSSSGLVGSTLGALGMKKLQEASATETRSMKMIRFRAIAKKKFQKGTRKTFKAVRGIFRDFYHFLSQGRAFELAIGLVIGAALTNVVTSLVNDIFSPILGLAIGSQLENVFVYLKKPEGAVCERNETACDDIQTPQQAQKIGAVTWNYGAFLQSLINFFFVAILIFTMIRTMIALQRTHQAIMHRVRQQGSMSNLRTATTSKSLPLWNASQWFTKKPKTAGGNPVAKLLFLRRNRGHTNAGLDAALNGIATESLESVQENSLLGTEDAVRTPAALSKAPLIPTSPPLNPVTSFEPLQSHPRQPTARFASSLAAPSNSPSTLPTSASTFFGPSAGAGVPRAQRPYGHGGAKQKHAKKSSPVVRERECPFCCFDVPALAVRCPFCTSDLSAVPAAESEIKERAKGPAYDLDVSLPLPNMRFGSP